MRYRALTISREYGSGGAAVSAFIAEELGWRLVNDALLDEISSLAKVSVASVASLDERVDPWLHRVVRPFFGTGPDGFSLVTAERTLDADMVARLTRTVIEGAHREGNCVIVGRGAQCVLHGKSDVFHVFAYAPWADRVCRVRNRVPAGADVARWIQENDAQRVEYVRRHFESNRLDPHLYDLMVNTRCGCRAAARLIIAAMESAHACEETGPVT